MRGTDAPARVALIGYEAQENLGLRYLSSSLRRYGHQTKIFSVETELPELAASLRAFGPHIVGFSLIFQQMLPQFRDIARYLADELGDVHFTIGGHFPSFEPEAVMKQIPSLDTTVRFEGEDTRVELAERVASRQPWDDLVGLAYRRRGGIVKNRPRAPRTDLDELPWPDRDDLMAASRRSAEAALLGSRGCFKHCSFCSITKFYKGNGSPGRRFRAPARVVDEVEFLHERQGATVLLWQDDDFLGGGQRAVDWAFAIADEMIARGLHERICWKISCRSNEITRPVFSRLKEAGLLHVYMGVESGDREGLRHLNKSLTPDAHFRARDVLLDLDLGFDFGFMLLEPWSTFESVRNNIAFLRAFTADGSAVAFFCRMLPYSGTAAAARLRREQRLRVVDDVLIDYNFLDERLDLLYNWLLLTFNHRNHSSSGTGNVLRNLNFKARLPQAVQAPASPPLSALRPLIAESNRLLLDTTLAAAEFIEHTGGAGLDDRFLAELAQRHAEGDLMVRNSLAELLRQHVAA